MNRPMLTRVGHARPGQSCNYRVYGGTSLPYKVYWHLASLLTTYMFTDDKFDCPTPKATPPHFQQCNAGRRAIKLTIIHNYKYNYLHGWTAKDDVDWKTTLTPLGRWYNYRYMRYMQLARTSLVPSRKNRRENPSGNVLVTLYTILGTRFRGMQSGR